MHTLPPREQSWEPPATGSCCSHTPPPEIASGEGRLPRAMPIATASTCEGRRRAPSQAGECFSAFPTADSWFVILTPRTEAAFGCFQWGPRCQGFPQELQQKHKLLLQEADTMMASRDWCQQQRGTHTADHSRPHPGCPYTSPISPVPKKTPQKGSGAIRPLQQTPSPEVIKTQATPVLSCLQTTVPALQRATKAAAPGTPRWWRRSRREQLWPRTPAARGSRGSEPSQGT